MDCIIAIKLEGEVHALMGNDGKAVALFKDEGEAREALGYQAKHRQSYEGSMSACIHFIQLQPTIIPYEKEVIEKDFFGEPPYSVTTVRSAVMPGGVKGMKCNGVKAGDMYAAGLEPGFKPEVA